MNSMFCLPIILHYYRELPCTPDRSLVTIGLGFVVFLQFVYLTYNELCKFTCRLLLHGMRDVENKGLVDSRCSIES